MNTLNLDKIQNFNSVLFDFDMTLVNTKVLINQSILELLQIYFPNKIWNLDTIKKSNNQSDLRIVLKNLLSSQNISIDDKNLENLRIQHKTILAKQDLANSLAPDLEETLKALKNTNKNLVIVTNNDVQNVANLLGNLNIYFDFVVGVGYQDEDINLTPENYSEYKKPSSKMLEIAYKRLKIANSNPKTILVGDDEADQKAVENFNHTSSEKIEFYLYQPFEKEQSENSVTPEEEIGLQESYKDLESGKYKIISPDEDILTALTKDYPHFTN